jgi:hypothetical protein
MGNAELEAPGGRTDAVAAHEVTVDPPERDRDHSVGLAEREQSLMPQPIRDVALG